MFMVDHQPDGHDGDELAALHLRFSGRASTVMAPIW
jgi:hypothetical protein